MRTACILAGTSLSEFVSVKLKKYPLTKFSKFYNVTVKPKIMEKLKSHGKSWNLNISKEQTLIQVKCQLKLK